MTPPPAPTGVPRIAIVGGGWSGMAAAVEVALAGGVPTVFEAARILGGRARRIEYQDRVLDNGQHILSGAYRETLRLMDTVGVPAQSMQRVPLRLSMPPDFLLRAPLLPGPLHTAWALLAARGLSLGDRLAAVRLMQSLKRSNFVLAHDVTVDALLRTHRQTPNLIKHLWRPLTVSALNTPTETASAQVFANVLRDALAGPREASDLLLPLVDLTALFPDPAATWLQNKGHTVRRGASVTAIEANDTHVTLSHTGGTETFDAVIVAAGPHQRRALLPATIVTEEFEPITTIYMGFPASAPALPEAMLGQAEGLVQWFFDRRALAARPAPGAELVIAGVISASGPHDALENEALVAATLKELRRHADYAGPPIWHKVIREKFATFSCRPESVRPATRTDHARIFLAGDDIANPDALYPATLEGAVRNGIAAATLAMTVPQDKHMIAKA